MDKNLMHKYKYSVVISTYNWHEALDLILKNLVIQLHDPDNNDVEIIIADDGSKPITKEIISNYQKQFPAQIKHIWHEDLGFRKAMILNKAVVASSGEYLIFLDGDCVPFPDYLSMHKKLAEPGFFVAGNRVLLSKKFTQQIFNDPGLITKLFNWGIVSWLFAKLTKKTNKALVSIRATAKAKWRYLRVENWKYPKGCNVGIWRQDFIRINGYDESFSGWGHEDSDLFVRLLHSNVRIKDGRFAIPVLHLWHQIASRKMAPVNNQKLMERVADHDFIYAHTGINNYL